MPYDLISIGDSTLDTFVQVNDATKLCTAHHKECFLCFSWADKIPITALAQKTAGNAANVAIGASRLGMKTAICTTVGDDETGWKLKQAFEKDKVSLDYVGVDKEKPSNYSVVLTFKRERTILVYHQPRVYSLPKLGPTKWIYYTSTGKGYEKLQGELIKYLATHSKTKLAFNPGTHQMQNNSEGMKEILKHCEIVFLNKEETERIVGGACLRQGFGGQAKDMVELLRKLKATGPKIAVVTNGTQGSYAYDGKEDWFLPAFPEKAIEKTGAGDSFAIGFTAGRHHGLPIQEAMLWGNANSTSVVQVVGPQDGLLTREGVEKMLKKHKDIVARKIV